MKTIAGPFDSKARLALIVACTMLLMSFGGFYIGVGALNIYLHKEPVELVAPLHTISNHIGRWKAIDKDQILDEAMIEELGTRKYLQRTYAIEGSPREGMLNVHLAYYTGMIDAVPHVPDRCMVAAGYNIKTQPENLPLPLDTSAWVIEGSPINLATGRPYPAVVIDNGFTKERRLMPLGNFELRTTEFEKQDQPEARVFAGYFFIANGRVTPTPTQVRMLAFQASEKYAYYCKVQFFYYGSDATKEKFLSLVSEFLGDFLPELMQKLPDWSIIEHRDDSPRAGAPAT